MSRAQSDVAILRRLKRVAARHGLTILSAVKPSSKVEGGGYMLSNDATRSVVLGDRPKPYSADLEQIEAWLDALET